MENAISCNFEESVKRFLDPDGDVDDFQNLMVTSLSKDTSSVKFS